jgi:hypothetical protein
LAASLPQNSALPAPVAAKLADAFPNFFSLSRYDAARPRFSRYEPRGARRFFGDPMALIRFTATFLPTRAKKRAPPPTFFEKKIVSTFSKKNPYHGMMPHDLVFRATSPAALDDSLETPWRLFVLRPLFCRLGFEKGRRENFRAKTLAPISQTFFLITV